MENQTQLTSREKNGFFMKVESIPQLRQIFDSKTFYTSTRRKWIRNDYLLFGKNITVYGAILLGYGVISKIEYWIEKDNWKSPYGQKYRYSDCITLKYVNILPNPLNLNVIFNIQQKHYQFKHGTIIDEAFLDEILEKVEEEM
jgi:hypothetical protein